MARSLSPTFKPRDWYTDVPAEELPPSVVNEVQNAIIRSGFLSQCDPFAAVFGAASYAPRYLIPNQDVTNAYWLYASDLNVGVTDGTTHYNITPVGLSDTSNLASPWTGGVINQLPVLNNIVDGPYWWDQVTTNVMTVLPDWPAGQLANSMRPFREFLIAMNVFDGATRIPDLLRWSDAAAPGTVPQSWTAGTDSQAGSVSVSFNPGQLVDGAQLGERFYVYKTSSCYVLQLIGGSFVFDQKPVFATLGLLARDCVVEWRGKHILMTDGDLVIHDGLTVESLINAKQRREIFGNLDGTNFENSYLVLARGENDLYVCRPRVGETIPTEAITISLDDNFSFGRQALTTAGAAHMVEGLVSAADSTLQENWNDRTSTWNTDQTRWSSQGFIRTADFLVMADYTGLAFDQLGQGADLGGAALDVEIARKGLHFNFIDMKKQAVRAWLTIQGAKGGQVQLQLGAHDTPDADPEWSPEVTHTIGTTIELRFDQYDVEGYYLAYRVRSTAQLRWALTSIKIEIQPAGEY